MLQLKKFNETQRFLYRCESLDKYEIFMKTCVDLKDLLGITIDNGMKVDHINKTPASIGTFADKLGISGRKKELFLLEVRKLRHERILDLVKKSGRRKFFIRIAFEKIQLPGIFTDEDTKEKLNNNQTNKNSEEKKLKYKKK